MNQQLRPGNRKRSVVAGLIAALAITALDIAPVSAGTVKPTGKTELTVASETEEFSARKRRYRRGNRHALRALAATAGLFIALAEERRQRRRWRRHHHHYHPHYYQPPPYYYHRPHRRHRHYNFYFRF